MLKEDAASGSASHILIQILPRFGAIYNYIILLKFQLPGKLFCKIHIYPISSEQRLDKKRKPRICQHIDSSLILAETLTLMAENIGGTCQISPQKDAAVFFMSSSLMCSQGSR